MAGGRQIRVALLGCGAVARAEHVPALGRDPRVRLAAVCDRDGDRARDLAAHCGCRAFQDPAELLAREELDAVFVLTRPDSHAELAERALEAGAHVLVEKPFVTRTADADRLLDAADRSGRVISVVHNNCFHPAIEALHRRIADGEIGEVCSAHFLHGRRDQRFVPDPWYFEAPGGRLAETLPHALYLLIPLLPGLEVVHVGARRLGHIRPPQFDRPVDTGDDELHVALETPSGTWASILYSFNTEVPQSLLVVGTGGTLQAWITDPPRVTRWRARPGGRRELLRDAWQGLQAANPLRRVQRRPDPPSPVQRAVADFVDALASGRPPRISARDAREVVRLWEATVRAYAPSS